MTYLEALESELASAGIPARRRARILAEFADHLAENPAAELGAPRELARQFADQIGTRLARRTAYAAFVALAVVAIFLVVMFITGGRQHGWVGYGQYHHGLVATWWWGPLQFVCVFTAQVALGAGVLALLRAWRLRAAATITAADARAINRRIVVALIAAALTMIDLPLTSRGAWSLAWPASGAWWPATTYGAYAAIALLLSLLPAVWAAARLTPQMEGAPADLAADLGVADRRITPWHATLVVSALIVVVMTLIGIHSGAATDGLLRGIFDAAACVASFVVLGGYLGLRSSAGTAQ